MIGAAEAARIEALRRAFDERFAAPMAPRTEHIERLLLVELGGARFALRFAELAGIHVGRTIVRVPGGTPGFLGLSGIGGRVVPVFDLAALLGVGAAPPQARWIVLAGGAERVGLLVADVAGHAEIARADLLPPEGVEAPGPRRHIRELARVLGALIPVAAVGSVIAEIAARAREERDL